jgi:hypothetical protein
MVRHKFADTLFCLVFWLYLDLPYHAILCAIPCAILCLLSCKTDTKSQAKWQMRFGFASQLQFGVVAAIWCCRCNLVCNLLHVRKTELDSCQTVNSRYTKSHLKSHMKSHTCNQPLMRCRSVS